MTGSVTRKCTDRELDKWNFIFYFFVPGSTSLITFPFSVGFSRQCGTERNRQFACKMPERWLRLVRNIERLRGKCDEGEKNSLSFWLNV